MRRLSSTRPPMSVSSKAAPFSVIVSGTPGWSRDRLTRSSVRPRGLDGPAHGGLRTVGNREPDALAAREDRVGGLAGAGFGEGRVVVVDAQHVDRLPDQRQVALLDERPVGEAGGPRHHVGRVDAAQHRVEEDPVHDAVGHRHGVGVAPRIGEEGVGDADLLGAERAQLRAASPWPSSRWWAASKEAPASVRPGAWMPAA